MLKALTLLLQWQHLFGMRRGRTLYVPSLLSHHLHHPDSSAFLLTYFTYLAPGAIWLCSSDIWEFKSETYLLSVTPPSSWVSLSRSSPCPHHLSNVSWICHLLSLPIPTAFIQTLTVSQMDYCPGLTTFHVVVTFTGRKKQWKVGEVGRKRSSVQRAVALFVEP